MGDDGGGAKYHLHPVPEPPEGVDGRKQNAPLRRILEEVRRKADGRWYLIASYPNRHGAYDSAKRLRAEYPDLTEDLDLEPRRVMHEGELVSRLYVRVM